MKTITSTLEFCKLYPKAWEALPEAYRNDDVLNYRIDDAAPLYMIAYPKPDQEFALGRWIATYSSVAKKWIY